LDPPGGVIVRDGGGYPTGALKDAAIELVDHVTPVPTAAQRRRIIENALHEAASHGVTSVQDMMLDYGDLAVYSQLLREGKLSVRFYGAPPIEKISDQAKLGLGHAFGSASLRIGAVKMFADGSLGSRTAYFFEPYTDEQNNRGLLFKDMLPLSRTRERLQLADATELQVCTHAIGDAAISPRPPFAKLMYLRPGRAAWRSTRRATSSNRYEPARYRGCLAGATAARYAAWRI
jgi:predicted amidohydrolase YtcJ